MYTWFIYKNLGESCLCAISENEIIVGFVRGEKKYR